jgi:RNA polymerase I-specific transcription initiation factor RRN6
MLYSQLNNLIQLYTFGENHSGATSMVACSDPGILDLTIDGPGRITSLHMEPMQQSGIKMDVDFFRLFVVLSSSSVHELVIYAGESLTQDPPPTDQVVEDFTRSMIRRPKVGISKAQLANGRNETMTLDGLAVLKLPSSKTPSTFLKPDQVLEDISMPTTRDNELLCEALRRPEHPGNNVQDSVNINAVTEEVKQMLVDDPNSVPLPIGTLMEYANTKLYIPDVDEASSNLQDLLLENEENALFIQRIASARTLDLTEEDDPTISGVYDTLLQMWVAPLPPTVSSRVRQSKERLARRIAAEIIFSSMRVREHEMDEVIDRSHLGPSQDKSIALPILPSRPRDDDVHSASQYGIFQSLPTPPHSSVPPSSLPGSSPPVLPSVQSVSSDPLARLGKHLRNRNPSRDPVGIGANSSQVLRHWQVGDDPSKYNWTATERALQPEELDEESQRQREKERKRKERRERRQQREDELARAKAASQAIVFPRSSPGPMLGGMGSSSQVPGQSHSQNQVPTSSARFLAPQSQAEPGKFGGRLDKKKKKKGRMSGF